MNNIINKIIYTYICIEITRIYIYKLKRQTKDKRQTTINYLRIIIKIEFTNVVFFWCGVVVVWCTLFGVVWCNFTTRTDATLFFTFLFVLGKGKTFFVLVPINFLGGCAFFTPATESIGTYSIEIEYAALK